MVKADATPSTDSLKGQAFVAANRRLREAHPDEWKELHREEWERRGLKWDPRPTKEEREEQQLRELVAAHPKLARELTQRTIPDDN